MKRRFMAVTGLQQYSSLLGKYCLAPYAGSRAFFFTSLTLLPRSRTSQYSSLAFDSALWKVPSLSSCSLATSEAGTKEYAISACFLPIESWREQKFYILSNYSLNSGWQHFGQFSSIKSKKKTEYRNIHLPQSNNTST